MIGLAKYKQLLGDECEGMTDEEIKEIRDAQYQMSRIAFALWSSDKSMLSTDYVARIE